MNDRLFARDFSLVVIGQIVSIFGSAILRFALNLYVLDITGRADIFALVVAISAIPGIFFTPIGGGIADRFNRRNLMVIFDFSSSAVVLAFIIMLGTGSASVIGIGIILALLSIISSAYQPTVQASVPLLVSKANLASANGIVSGVGALSGMLGPILGGVFYGAIGLKALVIASCASFFFSAVMEIFIRIPYEREELTRHIIPTILNDMKIGMRYIAKENPPIIKIILLAAALNLFMSPFFIIGLPYVLRITMRSSETMYGIGMGIAEFSTILGAILVGAISKKLRLSNLHRLLFLSAAFLLPMAFSVTPRILGLGYWPAFVLFFAFGAVIMLWMTVISIFVITSVQIKTPNEMLGKVMAIIMAVSQCAAPLGQALYGLLFEQFSSQVYVPVLLSSLFTVVIAMIARSILKE